MTGFLTSSNSANAPLAVGDQRQVQDDNETGRDLTDDVIAED